MSCHDIGRGLNSVTKAVVQLLDEKEISKEAAQRLLHACRKGVHWCDGNEGEAMEALVEARYCGLCLEKADEVKDIYDNDLKYPDCYNVFDDYDKSAAHFFLCAACRQKTIDAYLKGKKDGKGGGAHDA